MSIKAFTQSNGTKLYEVYACVRTSNGRKIQARRRNIPSLHKAKLLEFELRRRLSDKRDVHLYTWGEWHRICLERMFLEMRPSTIENYNGRLKKWVRSKWHDRDIKTITPGDVHEMIYSVADASPHSRKTILKMVKRIFQMAVEENILNSNPAIKIKVKVPEAKQAVLSATEANALLREAKLTDHRFYEIWAVALLTGMRSGELYALKWTDVDLENNRIHVTRSWCSKAGFGPTKCAKNRVVPIANELGRLFREIRLQKPNEEFVLPHLPEWTIGGQALVLREFCQSIGITPVKFHDLRATFITQMLLKGVPLAQVMSIVGHSQLKTTNVYLRVTGSDLDGATNKLSFSLPPSELASVISLNTKDI